MQEKRRAPRRSALIRIIYRTGGEARSPSSGIHHFGTIVDSCRGGFRLEARQRHRIRETIWIDHLADLRRPFSGVVQWVQANDDTYTIGVKLAPRTA